MISSGRAQEWADASWEKGYETAWEEARAAFLKLIKDYRVS